MAVKDGLPATDFSRMNREYIKAVADGGSGGGGLPEITEADEGKVLTVESGEAAWATAGGGGGSGLVIPEFTPTGETTFSCDMTFEQIQAAINQNTCVSAKMFGNMYYLSVWEEDFSIQFSRIYVDSGVTEEYFIIEPEDVISYRTNTYPA